MFRKPTGAILCPRCGRLTHPDAAECLVCGLQRPGRWLWAARLGRLWRTGRFTDVVTVTCIVVYVASLLIDPAGALRPQGLMGFLSPSDRALGQLGAAGAIPWRYGHWWTLVTGIYLHGALLHILFNVLWIRQLGPAVEELYGQARLVIVFTLSGVLGYALSNFVGIPFTIGASGSIFGLLGAMVAYGRKRGGSFGAMVLRQYGMWAAILFVFGLLPGTGANNYAHAGGFVGGLAMGFVLSFEDLRRESVLERVIAGVLVALTALAFVLAIGSAVLG
ncbi:MAG: rhomboid family intramembrane serine protease [Candidatus Rokubacteria bacterium]|nr:rhomboid family intramembrane serine protease [Candidatus Rokubacteria bacterium]